MDIEYYKKYEPIDGKWYINKELGRGAFGTVFEIERRDFTNDKSALKIITIPASSSEVESYREENYDLDEKSVSSYFYGFVEEFIKEFQLMTKLKGNSNIVSIEDYDVKKHTDEIGWDILIRMELLTPMNKHFAQNPPKTRDVIKLGIDICKALEVCQKFNIVHRDIKPSNIFVSKTGEYKLGDFGVARTLEKTSSGLSKKGTYTYMAPEVYKGEAYGSNVDIYSLGIVMYKLLNNNMEPYKQGRTHEDEENALIARLKGEPISKPTNADGRLAEIILKACSFESKDRYESPLQMRNELESILYSENEEKIIYPEGESLDYEPSKDSINEEPVTSGVFDNISQNDIPQENELTKGIFDEKKNSVYERIEDEETCSIFDEKVSKDSSKEQVSNDEVTEKVPGELSLKEILIICGTVLLLIIAIICGTVNQSKKGTSGEISWVIENNCITLTGEGNMSDYTLETGLVDEIDSLFSTVYVPEESNVVIGEYAFVEADIVSNGNYGVQWKTNDVEEYIEPSIILEGVKKIGKGSFQNNMNLSSILVSSKLIEIDEDAFINTGIRDIYFEGTIDEWSSVLFKSASLYPEVIIHVRDIEEFKLSDCVYDENGKYIYRNITTFQYDGEWADYRYDNGVWNGNPFIFSESIKNCTQFDIKIVITSVKYGNPYGNWGVYIRDENNKWHKVDSISVKNDGNASWKTVSLKEEMNISGYKCLPMFSATSDTSFDNDETMFNIVTRSYN